MPVRDKIFVSYSHKDHKLFEEFETMMAPAIQSGTVDLWDDQKIPPGALWKEEIEKALASARISVLLVSENFLASHFITEQELPPLLQAAKQEGVTIFWIYLSPCLYEQTAIAAYQAAHDVSRPLNRLSKAQRQAVLSETCAKLIQAARMPAPSAETTFDSSSTSAFASSQPETAGKPPRPVPAIFECCILLLEAAENARFAAAGGPSPMLHRRLELADSWLEKGRELLSDPSMVYSSGPARSVVETLEELATWALPRLISEARMSLQEAGDTDASMKPKGEDLYQALEGTSNLRQDLEQRLSGDREFRALRNSNQNWDILGFRDWDDYSSYLYPTVKRLSLSTDPMQRDLFEHLLELDEFSLRLLWAEGYRKDTVFDTVNSLVQENWAEWTDQNTKNIVGSDGKAKLNAVGKRLLTRLIQGKPATTGEAF